MKLIVVPVLLIAAAAPVAAQVHTLENSRNPQDRIEARWEKTHPMNNQYDTRSFDERHPDATPRKKLDCDISHDSSTNVNTITGCRMVPR